MSVQPGSFGICRLLCLYRLLIGDIERLHPGEHGVGERLGMIENSARKDEGGFTGWLAGRLPHIPQSSAYRAIEIFKGVSEEMFLNFGNIRGLHALGDQGLHVRFGFGDFSEGTGP